MILKNKKKVIDLGGVVDAKNATGATSLHYYAGCRSCTDPIKAMKHLIQMGADINATDAKGRIPLKNAELKHIADTRKYLTSMGAKSAVISVQP